MWRECMFKALYSFVHGIYTIFEYVHSILVFVSTTIVSICHEVFPATEKNKQIQNDFNKLTKTPAHLTVLLGHEEPSLTDMVNLIIWCLATRISFISFYDYKGSLEKYEDELRYEVSQIKSKEDHVIWHNSLQSSYKNGFIGNKVHVKIISEKDGRNSLVQLTKKMAIDRNEAISLESISDGLRKHYEFPDPDFGLVCGETFSFYNYPPWQIRVTEFFTIKSLSNITFPLFLEQLVKFSRCEQRLGK